MKILERNQLKNLMGGSEQESPVDFIEESGGLGYCGYKIDGVWNRVGNHSPEVTSKEISKGFVQAGIASSWCCKSCPWN